MSDNGKSAFITGVDALKTVPASEISANFCGTGGASGIGQAVASLLVRRGVRVYIADLNAAGAQAMAHSLNSGRLHRQAWGGSIDVSDWDSQRAAFEAALDTFGGTIDWVLPIAGIGERPWLPRGSPCDGFQRPNLAVIDVDQNGVLYTAALAIQHFRWIREKNPDFRGKIITVASVCGFYIQPFSPLYTAAKHAVVGFVRSYGKVLADEKVTMTAICPNKVRTNISASFIHDQAEKIGALVPMEKLMEAFEMLLPGGKFGDVSGECLEVAPKSSLQQYEVRLVPVAEYLNEETKRSADLSFNTQRMGQ